MHREEAAEYLSDPTEGDSRRGLKRTWQSSSKDKEDGRDNPASQDKGKHSKQVKRFLEMRKFMTKCFAYPSSGKEDVMKI